MQTDNPLSRRLLLRLRRRRPSEDEDRSRQCRIAQQPVGHPAPLRSAGPGLPLTRITVRPTGFQWQRGDPPRNGSVRMACGGIGPRAGARGSVPKSREEASRPAPSAALWKPQDVHVARVIPNHAGGVGRQAAPMACRPHKRAGTASPVRGISFMRTGLPTRTGSALATAAVVPRITRSPGWLRRPWVGTCARGMARWRGHSAAEQARADGQTLRHAGCTAVPLRTNVQRKGRSSAVQGPGRCRAGPRGNRRAVPASRDRVCR
jgi:hypothetical protein